MGHFGSFLGHFGNFGSYLGQFGQFWVIFGPFFGANFLWQNMCYLNRFLQLCGCEIQLWKGTESSLLQTGARPAWLPGANKCTIVSRALLQSSLQPTFLFFLCFCLLILSFTFFFANFGFSLATCYFECTYSQEKLQLHLHEYDLLPFLEELRQKLHFQESDSIQTSKLSKSSLAKPYCWKLLLKS